MEILVLRKADHLLHSFQFLQPIIIVSKPKQQRKLLLKITPYKAQFGNIAVKA